MKDSWFLDKNLNGVSDDILEEFFNFPIEDVETDVLEGDWNAQFSHLEVPSLGVFSLSSSGPCGKTDNENTKMERNFPASLAKTARPTHGKTIPIKNVSFNGKDLHKFQSYSPVSVFENSSSSSVENSSFDLPVIPAKRRRGKRQRPSNFSKLFSIPFLSTSPAFRKHRRTTESKSDLEAQKSSSRGKRKQGKKDPSLVSADVKMKRSSSVSQESISPRKCTHCEVTETPQWREGPRGPKTLCNACGVRYRSGRLVPEYRPAASPTFVASLHSNSHKKVLEIRNRVNHGTVKGSSMLYLSSNLPGNSLG